MNIEASMAFLDELRRLLSGNTLIVCLGNTLRGDDAIGILVGRRLLKEKIGCRVLVYEDGLENHLGEIGRLKPSKILVVDAVDAGLEPGTIVLAKAENASHIVVSTHKLPLSLMYKFLRDIYGVEEMWVLGIQVERTDFGGEVSKKIREAGKAVVRLIKRAKRETID